VSTPTQSISRLPVIPAPPHDPTSLLIDGRNGWHLADPAGLAGLLWSTCNGSLSLDLKASLQPSLVDPTGTLGGLVLPPNVAVTNEGAIYLLDQKRHRLKRFDPCTCCFIDVPCIAAHGGGARELRNPGGIAICCGVLYVADTGRDGRLGTGTSIRRHALRTRLRRENHRVSMFLTPGGQLRGHLRPNRKDFPRWRPVDVACDARGVVWVADSMNGAVHRFTPRGRSKAVITALDGPERVTIGRDGCIYVLDRALADDRLRLRVFSPDGVEQPAPGSVEQARPAFGPLPFPVRPGGLLQLADLCHRECSSRCTTFDLSGSPVPEPTSDPAPFLTSGSMQTHALDSRTRACQWHRVILHGDIPNGTRVRVETFAADEEYDANQVAGFANWARRDIAPRAGMPSAAVDDHDCLVPSPPGRFLWLRVTLLGNGRATPVLHAIEIEFPRLTSLRFLPAVFAAESASADFTSRFLSLFDTTLRQIERTIDTEARYFDPAATPAERVGQAPTDFLTWLASWIGVTFDRTWAESRRRRVLAGAGRLFARRGTVAGLRQQVLDWLGWTPPRSCGPTAIRRNGCSCRPANCAPAPTDVPAVVPPIVLEHFKLRRWLFLGTARVGAQAVLWGQRIINRTQLNANAQVDRTRLVMTPDPKRDPLHFYAHGFTVFVPACAGATDAERRSFVNLLRAESPAHTRWDVAWVEPRFRIGVQSMIGFDAVVGAVPPAAHLGSAILGGPTLVGPGRTRRLRAGRSGRVGLGSQLD
jgi:phage tail-like protein